MKSNFLRRVVILGLPGLMVALAVTVANAAALQRLSSEFQNEAPGSVGGEVVTTLLPGTGGLVVYDKVISLPQAVTYITFSAQGDTHLGTDPITGVVDSAVLLMTASITDSAGNVTVCQPMANAGGAAEFGAPWMSMVKLPPPATGGCNGGAGDGFGGPADCHDNAFSFSCCTLVSPDASGTTHEVKIAMASSNGAPVFYEDSTIYIDSGPNAGGSACKGVGIGKH
jgi:hypothetical protein